LCLHAEQVGVLTCNCRAVARFQSWTHTDLHCLACSASWCVSFDCQYAGAFFPRTNLSSVR